MYLSLNNYLNQKFGGKVYKVALDIGCTCPNRDGTKGVGGCTFCSERGSGDYASADIDTAILRLGDKACGRYIAYYQAFTNTYCEVDYLKGHVDKALARADVCGVAISTRVDCITEEMYRFLEGLATKTWLTVELGLQTIRDDIAIKHNRCHTYQDFEKAYIRLKQIGVRVTVHIINGMVGESWNDMLSTARQVARLGVDGVKIHCLHVMEGTVLATMYQRGQVPMMKMQDYCEIVARQVAMMPRTTVIERMTGDGEREKLIAPLWSLNKKTVLNNIAKAMSEMGWKQGDLLNEKLDGDC